MSETDGFLEVEGGRLAWRRIEGRGPTVIWCGGFRSDMTGTKAQALSDWAQDQGRAFLRFDYFAHGVSPGEFREGGISRWRADALAVIDHLTTGPVVIVGSSMGGWIACLAALSRPDRVAGMVLIAPAPDFTEKLMSPNLGPKILAEIQSVGEWTPPPSYAGDRYPITHEFLQDGARWSILDGPIAIHCPVVILQGGADDVVPWRHAQALALAIESQNVVFTLVKDGDHRLSRDADIVRMLDAVEAVTPA